MASFFRSASGTRNKASSSPRPPPVASNSAGMLAVSPDVKAARRVSRTDADFERALLTSETVHLHEGYDVSELGTPDFASPPRRPSRTKGTPATPTVLPPTPRSGAQHQQDPAFSLPPGAGTYDPDDIDIQVKRRSMFRSPGTASSPDLATLVRRARDRGGVVGEPVDESTEDGDGLRPSGKLFPPSSEPSSRQRTPSSVSSNFSLVSPPSPPPKTRELAQDIFPQTPKASRDKSMPNTPEWEMTSPRQRTLSKDGMKVTTRFVPFPSPHVFTRPAVNASHRQEQNEFLSRKDVGSR